MGVTDVEDGDDVLVDRIDDLYQLCRCCRYCGSGICVGVATGGRCDGICTCDDDGDDVDDVDDEDDDVENVDGNDPSVAPVHDPAVPVDVLTLKESP